MYVLRTQQVFDAAELRDAAEAVLDWVKQEADVRHDNDEEDYHDTMSKWHLVMKELAAYDFAVRTCGDNHRMKQASALHQALISKFGHVVKYIEW